MAKVKEEVPEGYVIPFHRSLTQPMYWMGVPRLVLILEVFGAILGGVIFKTLIVPFAAVAVHFLFRYFGGKDPDFHKVFWASKSYKSYYHV